MWSSLVLLGYRLESEVCAVYSARLLKKGAEKQQFPRAFFTLIESVEERRLRVYFNRTGWMN